MEGILNVFINSCEETQFFTKDKDYFDSKPYLDIKGKLPPIIRKTNHPLKFKTNYPF